MANVQINLPTSSGLLLFQFFHWNKDNWKLSVVRHPNF